MFDSAWIARINLPYLAGDLISVKRDLVLVNFKGC